MTEFKHEPGAGVRNDTSVNCATTTARKLGRLLTHILNFTVNGKNIEKVTTKSG